MTYFTLPFLYLPDAISLLLLLPALGLLRRIAIAHLRQELFRVRREAFLYWFDRNLPLNHPAYMALCNRINLASRLAAKLSPARLFFIFRLCNEFMKCGKQSLAGASESQVVCRLESVQNRNVREKLLRAHLEVNFSLGLFFLLGSISGWVFFPGILFRMLLRTSRGGSDHRIDRLFDLAERLFARVGYRVQRLAALADCGLRAL